MPQKKLGKNFADMGLTELLSQLSPPTQLSTESPTTANASTPASELLQYLPIQQLVPSRLQPRQHFDEEALAELAESIRTQGILQPIIARPLAAEQFEIIAGERRWRAAQLANFTPIPVLIRTLNDQDAMAIALIENIQRQDLNVIEEAQALQRLLEEFQLTHQQIATAVGKSRTTITNLLRLLNLTADVKQFLATQQLDMGHARALLSLSDTQQVTLAQQIVNKQLSVRATEQWVNRYLYAPPMQNSSKSTLLETSANDPKISQGLQQLREKLHTEVEIKVQGNGKGKLVIHYKNLAKLQAILNALE